VNALKIRLVCTLWGEPFVDLFWRVSVRSLLAPGNAADVARKHPVRLSIVTTRKDASRIRSSPSFAHLASTLPVDFTTVGPLEADRSDPGSHALLWRAALAESRRRGETVIFVIPDVLYPRGTLTRWVERLEAGAAAVFSPALQVVCETALPELEERFPDPVGPLDLDADEAGTLGLRHLHPLWIAHVRGSPRASFHPEYLLRAVVGGVNIRLLALFPFCVDPRRAGLHAGIGRSEVPVAWDPVTVLSLEPACKQLDRAFRGAPLDRDAMTGLGGWFDDISAVEHPAIGVDFAVSTRSSEDHTMPAAAYAASFFVTQARLSRRIHRIWRAMHRLGCHDAARVLATAHFALPLRRRWRHRGAVTVLVPRVTIGDGNPMTRAAVHHALTVGHEPALAALIDAHVIPGDVTLRDGASYVQVESAPDRPADLPVVGGERFTTAAGATFEAADGSSARASFRVLRRLVADGIAVYAIDRILLPPDKTSLPRRQTVPQKTAAPPITRSMETSAALDPWLERRRRRAADARQGGGWRRLSTVTRWVYHHVLASRPPLSRRLGVRMTRRRLGEIERRRLDEAFTILGLGALGELAAFHETLSIHGAGASPLRRELERITQALGLEPAVAGRRLLQVVTAKPDVAEAWLGLGYLAADRGAFEAALEYFDRAVAGRPYLVPGNSTLLPAAVAASAKGRLLEQLGRLAEAEASYAVAVAAGAKSDVRRRYARLLRARGALDEACLHFDRAVPWDGRAHPFPRLPRLLDDIVRAFRGPERQER
jgi:hypothetical protein